MSRSAANDDASAYGGASPTACRRASCWSSTRAVVARRAYRPGERAPVGLVAPVRAGVGRALGQRRQLGRDVRDQRRHRQLGAEQVQLLEVVLERARRLHPQRALEHVGGDERVAVAVAADPRADAQEGGHLGRGLPRVPPLQLVLEVAVQRRHLGQEGLLEERQAVGHLVQHVQLFQPQHACLPQRQHGAADRLVIGGEFLRRELRAFAGLQQALELHLQVAHALALHFGRVRGEHRHDHAVTQDPGQGRGIDADRRQPVERLRQAAVGRGLAVDVGPAPPPAVVQVLGQVGQVREVAEGPHHDHGLLAAQPVEQAFEVLPRRHVVVAAEGDRALPHALDQLERGPAFLLAHRVAEQPAEQADVVAQRAVG